jgi:hypothetical protein
MPIEIRNFVVERYVNNLREKSPSGSKEESFIR